MKSQVKASLSQLCRLFGISRQSFYQYWEKQDQLVVEQKIILDLVNSIRKDHPVIGTRKLYVMIGNELKRHHIKMGRDKLYNLLAINGMLLRRRKRRVRTTFSNHRFRKYPNMIAGLSISRPNQVWVSDITYWRVNRSFLYLSLITDAYSRKIVGYQVADNLKTCNSLEALKTALQKVRGPFDGLIHHSDRGFQYCSGQYTDLLQSNGIRISMTQSGDPLENPLAERMNGIVKNEYLNHFPIKNLHTANDLLEKVINRYNKERPHSSCMNMVPEEVHSSTTPKLEKYNLSSYTRNRNQLSSYSRNNV
jgi:transposase InsO family protein